MNAQEVFNRNWEVFVVQGYGRSRNYSNVCVYVTKNHPGCAVGCCLTDEMKAQIIQQNVNDRGIDRLFKALPYIEEYFDTSRDFLVAMQDWHDGNVDGDPEHAAKGLKQLANDWGLEVPED